MLKKWLKIILDIIYPPKCPGCNRQAEQTGEWCGKCLEDFLADNRPREFLPAKYAPNSLDGCLSVCHYQGVIRNLIRKMKFQKNKQNGVKLAYLLENSLKGKYRGKVDFVVPVPLHAQKLKERGFNQVEAIFRPWAEKENIAWLDCLERTRPTRPQWKLTLQEREENVKGAFALTRLFEARPYLAGKSILLVDDIFTTGSTIKECVQVLKEAKAGRIFVLTLASGGD